MNKNLNYKFFLIILFSLLALIGCKQKEEQSLQNKIKIAVESRKIPSLNNQEIIFASPHWVEERSSQNSWILRHLEDYLPTIIIEKGIKEVTDLPEN